MRNEDRPFYDRAVDLANHGQTKAAYDLFQQIRAQGNEDIELYFWIVATTPYAPEARAVLDMIKVRQPYHPSLAAAQQEHDRKIRRQGGYLYAAMPGPVLRCPFCGMQAPAVIQHKVSTGGWVTFVILLILFFPVCWIGLLITEGYRVCSYCGVRLG